MGKKANHDLDDMRSIRYAIKKVKDSKYEEALRFLEHAQQRRNENSELIEEFIDDLRQILSKKYKYTNYDESEANCTEAYFTESQKLLVQEILARKSLYKILNVSRYATMEDIKKSYKRLLLQLHPDKNSAPDAAVAFQMVSNAFNVLSDKNKRKLYDAAEACGTSLIEFDANKYQVQTPIPRDYKSKYSSAAFDMLFCQHTNIFNVTTTRTLLGSLLVAVILAFGTTIFIQTKQFYSLTETCDFNVRQVTQRLRIPYYVKAEFQDTYKGDLIKLETDVEQQYITIIDMNCKNERRERENAMTRARQAGNHWEYARIYSIRLKSCDVLARFDRLHPRAITSDDKNNHNG